LPVQKIVGVVNFDFDDAEFFARAQHARDGRSGDAQRLTDFFLPDAVLVVQTATFEYQAHIVNQLAHMLTSEKSNA